MLSRRTNLQATFNSGILCFHFFTHSYARERERCNMQKKEKSNVTMQLEEERLSLFLTE